MWSDSEGSAAARSGVAGLAYLSGVCGSTRYSVCEEQGGFSSIAVAAHELGHK